MQKIQLFTFSRSNRKCLFKLPSQIFKQLDILSVSCSQSTNILKNIYWRQHYKGELIIDEVERVSVPTGETSLHILTIQFRKRRSLTMFYLEVPESMFIDSYHGAVNNMLFLHVSKALHFHSLKWLSDVWCQLFFLFLPFYNAIQFDISTSKTL